MATIGGISRAVHLGITKVVWGVSHFDIAKLTILCLFLLSQDGGYSFRREVVVISSMKSGV
jgi:hypothetical protein